MTNRIEEAILPEILETERLHLRPLTVKDADRIVSLANNPNITYLLGSMPHPYTHAHAEAFLNRCETTEMHVFGICLKSDKNLLIGTVGVGPRWSPEEPEVGFWLGEEYWEQRYSAESVEAILTYAFEFLNYEKVYCSCRIENERPRNVISVCNMVYLGRTERQFHSHGKTHSLDKYFLTRQMWQEKKQTSLKAAQ